MKVWGAGLLSEAGFDRAEYEGQGRFRVVFEQSGVVDRPVHFFSETLRYISLVPDGEGVRLEGKELTPEDQRELERLALDLDGRVRVVSKLAVVAHNADSSPWIGGGAYQWRLTASSSAPIKLTTSGEPVAPLLDDRSRLLAVIVLGLLVVLIAIRKGRKRSDELR